LYFDNRLKYERGKTDLERNDEFLLDRVLTKFAQNLYRGNASYLDKEDFVRIISKTTHDKPTKYFNLLKRAEIIAVDEQRHVRFFHFAFYDFYLARALQKKVQTKEDVEALLEAKKYQTLVYLCGIIENKETLDLIVRHARNIDVMIDCYCNADLESPKTTTFVINSIIEWLEHEKEPREVFRYIQKYGARICGQKLHDYLEEKTKGDLIQSIEWEFLKKHKLFDYHEPPTEYRETYRFAWLEGHPDFPIEAPSGLGTLPEAQNRKGYEFYQKEASVKSPIDMLHLAVDTQFGSEHRVPFLVDVVVSIDSNEIQAAEVWQFLKGRNHLFGGADETFKWLIVTLARMCAKDLSLPDDVASDLIEAFCIESSAIIKARIMGDCFFSLPALLRVDLLEEALGANHSPSYVDVDRIVLLAEEFLIMGIDNSVGDFVDEAEIERFRDQTYDTLIKFLALRSCTYVQPTEQLKQLLRKYCESENDILRVAALKILNKLDVNLTQ
jgi:hypothetical protein